MVKGSNGFFSTVTVTIIGGYSRSMMGFEPYGIHRRERFLDGKGERSWYPPLLLMLCPTLYFSMVKSGMTPPSPANLITL